MRCAFLMDRVPKKSPIVDGQPDLPGLLALISLFRGPQEGCYELF